MESRNPTDEQYRLLPLKDNEKEVKYSTAVAPATFDLKRFCHSRNFSSRRLRKRRVVSKLGDINIEKVRLARPPFALFSQFFRSLVEARWRCTLATAFLANIVILLIFACIWWLICYIHGDLEPEHMPDLQPQAEWEPCITNIYSFTSCFLFSIEIQTTIGYGSRHSNESCPETIIVMCIQNLTGLILSSFAVGIVFAKLMRPKHRTHTLIFSKFAVISQRNCQLCLMFRVGNVRKARIIDPRFKAFVVRPHKTKEGELIELNQEELVIQVDGCDPEDPLFIWPVTIIHIIDSHSPFYHIPARELMRKKMEIIVVLDGLIESTGQDVQALSSYTTNEILWGYRFETMITYNLKLKGYEVDYAKLDATVSVATPTCSASQLEHNVHKCDLSSMSSTRNTR